MLSATSRDISEVVETLDATRWDAPPASNLRIPPVEALEDGKILYFPRLAFTLEGHERRFLSPEVADGTAKNVSFDAATGDLRHAGGDSDDHAAIAAMMRRYHDDARRFVALLLPQYAGALISGRTSYRPVEIEGRPSSARKDDTRLHIDAFPSMPMGGKRILRVFSNVNPDGHGRHWRIGAPFEDVARHFAKSVPAQMPGSALLFSALGITKGRRTGYDHAMLNIHDTMKADDSYQANVVQNDFDFPPGSTWIVFTDKTSHAATSGQYLFEQTFYLPIGAMASAAKSPLRILEQAGGCPLL